MQEEFRSWSASLWCPCLFHNAACHQKPVWVLFGKLPLPSRGHLCSSEEGYTKASFSLSERLYAEHTAFLGPSALPDTERKRRKTLSQKGKLRVFLKARTPQCYNTEEAIGVSWQPTGPASSWQEGNAVSDLRLQRSQLRLPWKRWSWCPVCGCCGCSLVKVSVHQD